MRLKKVEREARREIRDSSGLIKESEAVVVDGKRVDAFMPNRAC